MAWFNDARFGLFFHWGLYAAPAGQCNGKPVEDTGQWNTIVKSTPFKPGPMKGLATACKEAGLRFCFYQSIMDWHHPDAQRMGYPDYYNAPSNPAASVMALDIAGPPQVIEP